MKTRPNSLKYLAAFLLGVGVGIPLQIMALYGHSPLEIVPIAAKLTPLNWGIMLMSPLVAWLIYRASPWAVLAVPMLSYLVIVNNWFVAEMAIDYPPLVAGLGTGAFLAAMSVLLQKQVRDVLLHPERRWWLTPRRRRAELPVMINFEGTELVMNTFDISESGAFIQARPTVHLFEPGRVFTIFLDLKSAERIQCRAEVVRQSQANGAYPDGVGVRFVDLGWQERRAISKFAEAGPNTTNTPLASAA